VLKKKARCPLVLLELDVVGVDMVQVYAELKAMLPAILPVLLLLLVLLANSLTVVLVLTITMSCLEAVHLVLLFLTARKQLAKTRLMYIVFDVYLVFSLKIRSV